MIEGIVLIVTVCMIGPALIYTYEELTMKRNARREESHGRL